MGRKRSSNTKVEVPRALVEQLVGHLDLQSMTLDEVERALESVKKQLGQLSLGALVEEMPDEDRTHKACPRCGRKVAVRSYAVPRTLETLSGTQTFRRNYHYCVDCKAGFYPRDLKLGLPEEGELSVELEKRVFDFTINDMFEEAASRFHLHYGTRLSSNQFRQVAKRLGQQIEASDEELLQLELFEPQSEPAEILYALCDGSMISMQSGDWREVKVGVVFRSAHHRPSQPSRRGAVEQARYVAILGGQEPFFDAMQAALHVEQCSRASAVVWLGDGARGNWTLAHAICPRAIEVLDICHAIENGMRFAKVALGEGDPLLATWQRSLEHLLYAGAIEPLIGQLMDCLEFTETDESMRALDDIVRYYRENRERMRYDEFIAKGYMIGSGIVESAHRHVIQKRMKQAGQHWAEESGRRMARLRAAYKTAGPERCHAAILQAHRRTRLRDRHWNRARPTNTTGLRRVS